MDTVTTNIQEHIPGAYNPLPSEVTAMIAKTVVSKLCSCKYQDINSAELNVYAKTQGVLENCTSNCDINKALSFLSLPPKFTTVRVNLLRITIADAVKLVEEELRCQYSDKTALLPLVYPHHSLPEVMVIESNGIQNARPVSKEVIVGRKCGSAVLRGAEVYAPGVLGASPSLKAGDPVAVFVDLKDTCLRGCKYFNGKKMFVGNGIARQSRRDLFTVSKPTGVVVAMTEQVFDSPSLGNFRLDICFLQNLPSMLCAHIIRPEKHARVLDMCAAPGGKTTHIASLMCNTGQVIAIDRTQSKVDQIDSLAKQLGLSNIVTYVYDSTKLISETKPAKANLPVEGTGKNLIKENSYSTDSFKMPGEPSCEQKFRTCAPPYTCSSFKWILLDAPCSALGQRPQIHKKMNLKELQSFPVIQRNLLYTAVKLLEPGGKLVYSTCTVVPEENEKMVKWLLEKFTNIQLIDTFPKLGKPGLLHCGLDGEQCNKVQRFGPFLHKTEGSLNVDEDTIGFFIAAFIKLS